VRASWYRDISLHSILVSISVMMYFASLFLPCIYVAGRIYYGFPLLKFGWLGPLNGIIAWYANPIYFYSVIKATQKHASRGHTAALCASFVAMTFLLSREICFSASGVQRNIDGYGIGYVLWTLSMTFLYISLKIRFLGTVNGKVLLETLLRNGALRHIIIALSPYAGIAVLLGAIWLNSTPETRKSVFKPVVLWQHICTQKNITPKQRIPLNGPLEVTGRDHDARMPMSLSEPQLLLSWGIPIVRRDGYDFTLRDPSDIRTMQAVKAKGEPSASLRVSVTDNILSAVLSSQDGSLAAFDSTWKWTVMHRYCPELMDEPRPDQSPRSLVMASLAFSKPAILPTTHKNRGYLSEYPTQKVVAENIRKETMKPAYEATLKSLQSECDAHPQFSVKLWRGGHPVLIRDTYHFIDHPKPNLFCDEKNAYVYFIRGDTLIIHKRSMENFRPLWDSILEVQVDAIHDLGGFKAEEMKPVTITENGNKLHVTMGFKTVPPYTGFTGLQSFEVDLRESSTQTADKQ